MNRCKLLFLFLALAVPAAAQTKRPMTFDDLMAMHRVSNPQPSPDGKWVLFTVQDVDLAANKKVTHLWIVDAEGKTESRKVTSDKGESRGRFSPDGKQVLYSNASDGELYLAPFDSAAGTLDAAKQLTTLSTGADGGMWSPDSKRILFLSEVYPDCGADDACNKTQDDAKSASKVKAMLFTELMYRHWNAYLNAKRSHLLVMQADGTGIRDLTPKSVVGDHEVPTFSLGNPDDYAWAPDSREVAYVTDLDPVPAISTAKQIYAVRLDEPGAPVTKISQSAGGNYTPRYSPDGKWIAFRSQERAGYESDRFRLALYDREKKAVSYPLPKFDRWVDEIAWSGQDPATILLTSEDFGLEKLFEYSFDTKFLGVLMVENGVNEITATSANKKKDKYANCVVATNAGIRQPSEVISICGTGGVHLRHSRYAVYTDADVETNRKQLSHLNTQTLSNISAGWMDAFTFESIDSTLVQGFILSPPNFDATKKYPVKFLIHGGPQGAWGDAWSYRWNAELFAANGYVVVMINPRGSTGYGQKFIDEINGDWGGKPFDDLMAGLDYAEQHYAFIDKTRECALGASYGGYMADWILGHTHRFACIVTHDGMFDPAGAYGATEELWFNEWEFKGKPWDYFDKPASEDPYRKWSPALAAKNFKTPTLVVHGQLDYRLDVSQGFELFTMLQREGVPSEMLYFPDEGHWVLKPQDSQLWYKTVNAWCDRWTHTNGK